MSEDIEKNIKDQMAKIWMQDIDAHFFTGTAAAPQPQSSITLDMLQKTIDAVNALPKIDRLVKVLFAYRDKEKLEKGLEKFGFKKSPYMAEHYIEIRDTYLVIPDLIGIMVSPSAGCKPNHLILEWSSGKIMEIEVTEWEK